MNVGDSIKLDDITGEVIEASEDTYSVRWATGSEQGCVLTYAQEVEWAQAAQVARSTFVPPRHEPVYRMGGELVPESGMKAWHNSRGIPWGTPYEGPDPITIRRMRERDTSIGVHLSNEHGIDAGSYTEAGKYYEHQDAHVHGVFRAGQEHYHRRES